MYLGCHVNFGSEQLLGSTKQAISYGANAFMFYTGAPQNTIRKSLNDELTLEALKMMKENNILLQNIICHAPYIINLANKKDPSKWEFSINFLRNEINRCEQMQVKYIVVHPGSAVEISKEEGLSNISEALNLIVKEDDKCMILLETMAGKGTECGSSLEEIKDILDKVNFDNIGVCLDSCHLNDAGYDMTKFDEFLNEFDEIIGINKIKCVHVNDSKNEIDTHKDRHANIGYGTLGFENILNIIYNERLKDIPKILETPYVGKDIDDKSRDYAPYLFEIKMIKEKRFNKNLIKDINEYYNKK
ncbi:MAG: deoxyribonuclease IV [Bacilli bacterium]|nr:deoxyribonuclease IV [Bacilli bacterium]